MNEASAAVGGLNGQYLNGRALHVNRAKARATSGNRSGIHHSRKSY